MRYFLSLLFLLLTCAVDAQDPLPKEVYDQFADPTVATINLPPGRWQLVKNLPQINRTLTLNGTDCTLLIDPFKDWVQTGRGDLYPIQIASVPTSTVYGTSPNGSGKLSQLQGPITPNTTQLAMIEFVPIVPGERVLIWAGCNRFDPVEPFVHIPATVKAVDLSTGIVTFEKPLGHTVPNYGGQEAMKSVVASNLWWKILPWGQWPDNGNWSKGWGVHHGMERFVGGMVSGVTVNDISFELTPATVAQEMPMGAWLVSTISTDGFTLNRLNVVNPWGSAVHQSRSFNSNVNTVKLSGKGLSRISTVSTYAANAFTFWGGSGMNFSDVAVYGTDIAMFNTEVNGSKIKLKKLRYNVEFTKERSYPSAPAVFGFYSVLDSPRIADASLDLSWSGGSKPEWYSYSPLVYDGKLILGGTSLAAPLDLGNLKRPSFDGTVVVGGIEYGPLRTETIEYVIPYTPTGSFKLFLPQGLYLGQSGPSRFRVLDGDNMCAFNDSYGNPYLAAARLDWTPFNPSQWNGIPAGDVGLKTYLEKYLIAYFNTQSKADARIQVQITYLPQR